MRNKRLTASRMAVVEMAARVAIVATAWAVGELASVWLGIGQLLVFGALVGGLRCQAWALAFPRIGGLEAETHNRSPTDRGSSATSPPSAPRRRAAGCAQTAGHGANGCRPAARFW